MTTRLQPKICPLQRSNYRWDYWTSRQQRTGWIPWRSIRDGKSKRVSGEWLCLCEGGSGYLKTLCWGHKIDIGEDNERWVSFKYGKLPNFCYWCGLVSHDEKECEKWLIGRGSRSKESQGYGAWLRATPYNLGKSSFMIVSSMGDGLGGPSANNTMEQLAKSGKKSQVDT